MILISSPSIAEILGNREDWVDDIKRRLENDYPGSYYSLLSDNLIDAYNEKKLTFKDQVHLEQQGHFVYGELINNILSEHLP